MISDDNEEANSFDFEEINQDKIDAILTEKDDAGDAASSRPSNSTAAAIINQTKKETIPQE